ncbi:MAG: galactosyldiacylglycerol synthase [Thermodesulfobacteriota bacterium]|jgi:processive 1,2-diacylglycerol beta-glucosyltransferase
MVLLYDKDTGALVGGITEEQLQFLIDHLEEESAADTDYYINQATLDVFEQEGAEPGLVNLLRQALGDKEGVEIQWRKD